MRFPPGSLKIGWKWWLSFSLLIAMPAFALALLGLRAVRAERIEREQQLREQQAQASRLANTAIANALERLEGELRRADDGSQKLSDLIVFSFNRNGLMSFHRDRVYFDEQSLWHNSHAEWSPETESLIEQAQIAEAQQHLREAAIAYRKLISIEPKLRDWAEFGLARIRYQSGDPRAEALLASDRWGGSEGITPMGLPMAFVACSYVERLPNEKRAWLIPLLEETILRFRLARPSASKPLMSRKFRGDHWMLEVKVSYSTGASGGGRSAVFGVTFGAAPMAGSFGKPNGRIPINAVYIFRTRDDWNGCCSGEILSYFVENGKIVSFNSLAPNPADAYVWRIKRNKRTITIERSNDGIDFRPFGSHTFGMQIDGVVQFFGISYDSFANNDAYADFDYVRLSQTPPRPPSVANTKQKR